MAEPIGPILNRALAGEVLSANDGYRLIGCDRREIPALLEAAGTLRDHYKGKVVTYSRKVFLPVTNLCRDRCGYCTFRKDPGDPGAKTMTRSEIHQTLERACANACKEALMCLGDKPELAFPQYRRMLDVLGHRSTVDYVAEACEIALEYGLLPHTNAGILSYREMEILKPLNASLGLMLENVSPRLMRKGMAHFSAPDKDPIVRIRMLREAGELSIPFTSGILLGIGETPEERVDSLLAVRQIHSDYRHIQEVIIQNFRAKPGTPMAHGAEPSAEEIAQTAATARLILGGEMNIQVPPNLNPKDHRILLDAGINDWGGISPVTSDYVNPESAWPHIDALGELCAQKGFTLQERLAIYDPYIDRPGFISSRVNAICDQLRARP